MPNPSETIGFIGLGTMGGGMALNCVRKGFKLVVFDIAPQAVARLTSAGATAAKSVAEVAGSADIVISVLPTGKEVTGILMGSDGVLAHARPGTLVMDMSTIDPETTDRLHAEGAQRGIATVDSPIGRTSDHAARGESMFMVGAEASDLERVRPVLEAMGTTIHHCGGKGTGTRTKLVNNFLSVAMAQLGAEALTLAQRFGLDLSTTLKVIGGTVATNGQLGINYPAKVLAGDTTPGFTIDLAHKDISLVVQAANAARSPVPMGAAAREAYTLARIRGYGSQDWSAMVDVLCDLAQVERARLGGAKG